MPYNFRPVNRDQNYLLPLSVKDWLPQGHEAWFVLDAMREIDLKPFYETYREDGSGGASFDPGMMVTLLVFAYLQGVRSSRRIEKKCQEEVVYRVITANQMPDHCTIARFRARTRDKLQHLFVEILRLCREAGLGDLRSVSIDGSKVAGNASLAANRTLEGIEKEVAEILKEAEEIDRREDEQYGKENRGDELPEELRTSEGRLKRLKEAKARLERAAEEAREKQAEKIAERETAEQSAGVKLRGRKPKTPEEAVDTEAKANITDPESRIMKTAKGYVQGYNAQAAVARDQIILAAEVTQEENDQHQFSPMKETVESNLNCTGKHNEVGAYLLDAGYCNEHVLIEISRGQTVVLMATQKDWKLRNELREKGCPRGRIPNSLSLAGRMERLLLTKKGKKLYAWRGKTVEPVFGQIKECRGCRHFSCRGLPAASSEWKLECAVHNLMKLFGSGNAKWN